MKKSRRPLPRISYQEFEVEEVKQRLGWEVLKPDSKKTPMFVYKGKKIFCENNLGNRPFYLNNCLKLKQEMLKGRWKLNGETRVFDPEGKLLDGQHSLCAFVLASEEYDEDREEFPEFNELFETFIVEGVDSSDVVANTLNTGKPRSLTDIVYRSRYFSGLNPTRRKQSAQVTKSAIRLVWTRVGITKKRIKDTHSEMVAFLENHPGILRSVNYILNLDRKSEKGVTRLLYLGQAAAMLYLMSASNSDPVGYRESLSELQVNFLNRVKAEKFWRELTKQLPQSLISKSTLKMIAEEINKGRNTKEMRQAVLTLGWNAYLKGKPLKTSLEFRERERDGLVREVLVNPPVMTGIDNSLGEEE